MKRKLREIWGKADDIILRYPMVLAMALLSATAAVVAIELDNSPNQFAVIKLVITGCLGISLMFAIKMLSQRIGKGIFLEICGILFLTGFYFLLPEKEKGFTEVYAYLIIPAYILSHLMVSFLPFFGQNREQNFWQYNKNLFINLFLTAVFTGVLVGGVMLAILAVDQLFDMFFREKLYPKTFSFLAVFGSCFIFLLFNDRGLQQLEEDSKYPQILKFFTQFVLIPLLIIYAVILYFYSGKILMNWELPRGWVSYLVLAYSIVGILGLLLVHPLKENGAKSWVKIFSKIFYYTLVPLIVLLFVAIFTRILEYGYTEPRYYVLIIALWLTTVVLYFIFFKKAGIKFIPVSLFIFGLFSLVFPYFNAFSVAKRSQKHELEKMLIEKQLLTNGKIDFKKRVTTKTVDEISDKIAFLALRNENEFVTGFLDRNSAKNFAKSSEKKQEFDILNTMRSQFTNVDHSVNKVEFQRLELVAENDFTDVSGYQFASNLREFNNDGLKINGDTFLVKNQMFGNPKTLSITLNGKEKVDLIPSLVKLLGENRNGQVSIPEIAVEGDLGIYHFKIVFENLIREKINNSKENIYFNNAFILLKVKN